MTYRGIYRDGYVRLEGEVDLRNGTPVDVNPIRTTRTKTRAGGSKVTQRARRSSASLWDEVAGKKLTKKERIAAALASYGAWKDRPEWAGKSSAEIAMELRKRASRRGRHV